MAGTDNIVLMVFIGAGLYFPYVKRKGFIKNFQIVKKIRKKKKKENDCEIVSVQFWQAKIFKFLADLVC